MLNEVWSTIVNNISPAIAVVIPCFRVSRQILNLIANIGPEVQWIFVIDDACPENSGVIVEQSANDPRVTVLKHDSNAGVGAAVSTGYRAALEVGATIIVKCDGDGQMNPTLINALCSPILNKQADYVKGNRFYRLQHVVGMPWLRVMGNAALSFMCKLSSGYWQLFDPNNGFTAIHCTILKEIPLERIAKRYFFESDMLYQLNQVRAVVFELPMPAKYADEVSSLNPLAQVMLFTIGHARNFFRRCVYSYFIRGFSLASIQLVLGLFLCIFALLFGGFHWWHSIQSNTAASAGTVMLSALPLLIGVQFLLSWLNFDIAAEPRQVVHPLLAAATNAIVRP
jgi:dolichol-phosphate mannosyltransferase